MALEELLPLFLGAPASAYAVATVWSRSAMRAVAEREVGFLRRPEVVSRYFVLTALFAVPIVFGVLLLELAVPFAGDPGSGSALRSVAMMFAVTSALVVLSEAWIVVHRAAVAFGAAFGRVLVLIVMPSTAVVYGLIVGFLVLGRLPGPFDAAPATNAMSVGALVAPLMAGLSNREESLRGAGFGRGVIAAAIAEIPPSSLWSWRSRRSLRARPGNLIIGRGLPRRRADVV